MNIQIITKEFYDYSLHIKRYSEGTIRRYKYVLELYCRLNNIRDLRDMTAENIRTLFFHGMTERKWATGTALVFHKSLHVFFKWCTDRRYISTNPIAGFARPKIEQRLPKNFTQQESLRLLDAVSNYPYESKFLRHRTHALFAIALFAGLRKSEILNLRYSDVDIDNQTLFVNQGKGSKDRVVPISPMLSEILQAYLWERKQQRIHCPQFFASAKTNRGLADGGLKRWVITMQKVTGMELTLHKLRHTFATLMLEGGCDIYSLSKMLGHTDIKTTTIYLHASVGHLREQIGKHPLDVQRKEDRVVDYSNY